jgi:hypothetical protein
LPSCARQHSNIKGETGVKDIRLTEAIEALFEAVGAANQQEVAAETAADAVNKLGAGGACYAGVVRDRRTRRLKVTLEWHGQRAPRLEAVA